MSNWEAHHSKNTSWGVEIFNKNGAGRTVFLDARPEIAEQIVHEHNMFPELVEALKDALSTIEIDGTNNMQYTKDRLRNALKKAKGGIK